MRAGELKGHLATLESAPRHGYYGLAAAGRKALAGKRADGRDFAATLSAVLEGRPCPGPA